ncbi:MAG: hypothetical protein JO306_00305 [Gemmatimonadetes bacterium]|nr:hypothetical protein [Gemmatimonadota bacterium]
MPTEVDLKIGLNMEIGSVPLSLEVEVDTGAAGTVYTFDGCVQDAVIPLADFISFVGQQFGVEVLLPPELALTAEIDYLAGQVIYTRPTTGNATTELGAAGRFLLGVGDSHYAFTFYADVLTGSGAASVPYVVGASVDLSLDFSRLPLVGTIPGFSDLSLNNVGFSYTNNDPGTAGGKPAVFHIPQVTQSANPLYTRSDPDARNASDYTITRSGNQQKFELASKGFALTAGFTSNSTGAPLQNFALPMALPATTPPPTNAPPAPFYAGKTSPPASSVHWVDVNKTFGPVNLQKVGLNYAAGEATFGLTAGFTMGGFTLGLQGLTVTFPLPLPGQPAGNTLAFDLRGRTLSIRTAGLQLGGAFLKSETDGVSSYYGEILVKAAQFGFKALGGYTPAHQSGGQSIPASLFLYANLNVPLGGPPYLYVTGLAGGFGVNNSLILPTLDELPTYILLPHNAPAAAGTAQNTVETVLPQLQKYFLDEPGEYWVAAGIQFTSFQMINAFALVTVSFGVDFQVGVLGSCSMVFPTGAPTPIAYVEIDLIASFSPKTGLLAVAGKLSPASYLFGSFCQLTGGFAFYVWFSGEHEGEFVVTLGGYHPAFVPPDYYPRVPRLGLNFSLGPFQVVGGAYFALTPAMFMAGASMQATWSVANIKAWFTIGADFLIAWAPFHYEADVYVSLGCSVNLGLFTLNVHAGADLYLWGPPFGGKAVVDLDVVSFTIEFGAAPTPPAPVGWASFKSGFLPADTPQQPQTQQAQAKRAEPYAIDVMTGPDAMFAAAPAETLSLAAAGAPALQADSAESAPPAEPTDTNVVKATVNQGLLGSDVDGQQWIVDPESFQILVSTTIPANAPRWGTAASTTTSIPNDPTKYGVLPVNVSDGPYLVLDPKLPTFSATQVWNPTLAVRPMGKNGVTSTLTLALLKRSGDGSYDDYITSIQAQPVTGKVPAALWMAAPATPSANDPAFVETALTGFVLGPIPRDPDQVNAVPLLELLFQQGNDAEFGYTAQAVDTRYTVATTFPAHGEMDIEVGGAHTATLVNTGWVLGALDDPWVASQRSAVLADLNQNGFGTYTPAEVSLTRMATVKALTDWPKVLLLGADLAPAPAGG